MDRTSLKVLKYLNKQNDEVSLEQIVQKYGIKGKQSLSRLCADEYISRGIGKVWVTHNTATGMIESKSSPNDMYTIEPLGRDFLEHKFWNDFDRWVTRISAVVGAITGITALVMHFI